MLVQIVSMKHNLVIMNYYGEEVVHGNLPGTLDLWEQQILGCKKLVCLKKAKYQLYQSFD